MPKEFLTGKKYIEMLMTGAKVLYQNKNEVNTINVFPIADNDTGENMCLTLFSGLSAIISDGSMEGSLSTVAKKTSDIMIYSGQGNSGIILAKIFQGISDGFQGHEEADIETIKKVFVESAKGAYTAVPNPVEGTMLSVFKNASEMSTKFVETADGSTNLIDFFTLLNKNLKDELMKTPESLDILKENSVVDSGALGLCYMFDGFLDALLGKVIEVTEEDLKKAGIHGTAIFGVSEKSALEEKLGKLEPGFYCTNFLISLNDKKQFPELKKMLDKNGSSIVCFMAGDNAKGHVHTAKPEEMMKKLESFGEILNYKVDVMEDEKSYTCFVDTAMDMTPALCEPYGLKLIKYPYTVDGKIVYPYVDWDEFDAEPFYQMMRDGVHMTTFALSKEQYAEYFEPEFKRGKDVLYVHQSEAPTRTFQFMRQAVEELKEKYPNRRFIEIDSKAFTAGGKLVALEVGDMYESGMTMDEIKAWADREIDNFAIYTTAKDLSFFVRSGRIGKAPAFFGNLVGVHPIVHGAKYGLMEFLEKHLGKKRTFRKMINYMLEDGIDVENHRIAIGNSGLLKEQEWFEKEIKKIFPNAEIVTGYINPSIGVHCGPDNVGFAFHGKKKDSPEENKEK